MMKYNEVLLFFSGQLHPTRCWEDLGTWRCGPFGYSMMLPTRTTGLYLKIILYCYSDYFNFNIELFRCQNFQIRQQRRSRQGRTETATALSERDAHPRFAGRADNDRRSRRQRRFLFQRVCQSNDAFKKIRRFHLRRPERVPPGAHRAAQQPNRRVGHQLIS